MDNPILVRLSRELVLLVWIAAAIALLEVGFEYRTHASGHRTLLFGAGTPPAAKAGIYGPTTEFPFRSRIIAADEAEPHRRIWIASASYGEDLGLAADMIFPNLLVDDLSVRSDRIEVLNASRAGAPLLENIYTMEFGFGVWNPDVAVLYNMSNDVSRLSRMFIDPAAGPASPDPPLSRDMAGPKAKSAAWYERVAESTKLYQGIKNHVTPRLAAERILWDEFPDAAQTRFRERLEMFVSVCRTHDVEPVLCTFAVNPVAFAGGRQGREILYGLLRYNVFLSMNGWHNAITALNDEIRNVGSELGVPVVDIAEAVNDQTYFRDFVHFTESGHRLVAETIAATLLETDALKVASP